MKGLPVYIPLILITLLARSQTIIPGGEVSGTWQASQSPFHVQGDIVINYDSTLIIEPGAEVYFDDLYKLTVNGRLDASGTEADSILFTATNTTTGWQGIEFYQTNEELGMSDLQYCILTYGKKNTGSGGAVYVYQSDNVLINHCRIEFNYAYSGGGIYIEEGDIDIKNCKISQNSAKYYAGGIACLYSVPFLFNLQIEHNTSADAGGIFFAYVPDYSYPLLENLTVVNNVGGQVGGIWFLEALSIVMDNCKICYNRANLCGGIVFQFSGLAYWGSYDIQSRIYMNRGNIVHDLFYSGGDNTIMYVDTFTVINPDSYHAFPLDKFNFHQGVQHGIIEQADADLYISDSGSDLNDGLTPQTSLRSFDFALRKIISDQAEKNTLWVLPGHYSLSESDSALPVLLKDYVNIKATVPGQAIIDGDSVTRVFYGNERQEIELSGLTIQNGFIDNLFGAHWLDQVCGAGMHINSCIGKIESCDFLSNSTTNLAGGAFLTGTYELIFSDCDFIMNSAVKGGGGLYAVNDFGNTNATLELDSCRFLKNSGDQGGGGILCASDDIKILKCQFIENVSLGNGAAAYFTNDMPDLVNCLFIKNIATEYGGACYIVGGSSANIINCVFSDNEALSGSAIYQVYLRQLFSINNIFWNGSVHTDGLIHIMAAYSDDYMRFYTNYSDIQGGENSIFLEGYYAKRYWQEGNIILDPEFIDPETGDYSLNWNSPCIEAGKPDTTGLNLPNTDLSGNPRIVNDRVDMGAYEYQFPVGGLFLKRDYHNIRIIHDKNSYDLSIEFPVELIEQEVLVKLMSINGSELNAANKTRGLNSVTLQTNNLTTGIYLMAIYDQEMKLIQSNKILLY